MWVLWSPNIVKENKKNPFPEIEEKWKRMTFGDTFVFSHSVRLNERFFSFVNVVSSKVRELI
ncbi:Uncharacterized protein APZ42_006183 [Daphnia magna]|uniref:Uncharacterized protein n=1 Tax=Daphnia magna TaxID=35525 RepID=A0A162BWI8_9CRUS|nr:Uncharacterized protein APZ42_006183 [Daphnia magna]